MPYYDLWSGAVLGLGASWSPVIRKGQGRSSWQQVTPCARSAVADSKIPYHFVLCAIVRMSLSQRAVFWRVDVALWPSGNHVGLASTVVVA